MCLSYVQNQWSQSSYKNAVATFLNDIKKKISYCPQVATIK